jgi:hypothetical protein
MQPESTVSDYRATMSLANHQVDTIVNEHMLLSWYDRDRDFESPQYASECHDDSATPGHMDYGLSHGATQMVTLNREDTFSFTCRLTCNL